MIRIAKSKAWKFPLLALLCLMLSVAGWYLLMRGVDNLHVVREGVLYRSAQLSPARLDQVLANRHIKSVLSLRGFNPDSRWHARELAVTRARNVIHYDFPFSALENVPEEKLRQLVDLMIRAPKPLLVHCEGGADRTGLAVAAWLYLADGAPAPAADRQLSLRYGHFPYLGSKSVAMDRSFHRLTGDDAGLRPAGR